MAQLPSIEEDDRLILREIFEARGFEVSFDDAGVEVSKGTRSERWSNAEILRFIRKGSKTKDKSA